MPSASLLLPMNGEVGAFLHSSFQWLQSLGIGLFEIWKGFDDILPPIVQLWPGLLGNGHKHIEGGQNGDNGEVGDGELKRNETGIVDLLQSGI